MSRFTIKVDYIRECVNIFDTVDRQVNEDFDEPTLIAEVYDISDAILISKLLNQHNNR